MPDGGSSKTGGQNTAAVQVNETGPGTALQSQLKIAFVEKNEREREETPRGINACVRAFVLCILWPDGRSHLPRPFALLPVV